MKFSPRLRENLKIIRTTLEKCKEESNGRIHAFRMRYYVPMGIIALQYSTVFGHNSSQALRLNQLESPLLIHFIADMVRRDLLLGLDAASKVQYPASLIKLEVQKTLEVKGGPYMLPNIEADFW